MQSFFFSVPTSFPFFSHKMGEKDRQGAGSFFSFLSVRATNEPRDVKR